MVLTRLPAPEPSVFSGDPLKFLEWSASFKAAATAADMEREGLPDSPTLIIQGESMTPSKWMLSVDREVVLGPFSEAFVEGLAALIATYYNLNLAYQDDTACTLEFIQ
ncbi:uncharacterized protein LOC114840354 isoform X2, partial [Tachysurus ichikawai]